MSANPDRRSALARLPILLCLFLLIAVGVVAVGAIASSRAGGGSTSPEDGAKTIAEGANIGRQSRILSQRVEDNAFHRKIAPWVTENTANGQQAEFFVVLADQADLSGAAVLASKAEKGLYVYDALCNKSQTTQGPILQWLRERGIEHRSFYIVNAVFVKGTREIAEALAARPDVTRVEGNPHIHTDLPPPLPAVGSPLQRASP